MMFQPLDGATFLGVALTHDKVVSVEGTYYPVKYAEDRAIIKSCQLVVRDASQPRAPPMFILPLRGGGPFGHALALISEDVVAGLELFFAENLVEEFADGYSEAATSDSDHPAMAAPESDGIVFL
eukprot:gb/GFBE01067147.1/.p1 GENE.gb/GFBE01067147.1/~~gb/GFBE01067147.1/.p1  ORF type:complete len:125 (+),score=23.74 gb/GFBE01067147.1/:1-375(+)